MRQYSRFSECERLGCLQPAEEAAFLAQIKEKLIEYIHSKTLANERQTHTHRQSVFLKSKVKQ